MDWQMHNGQQELKKRRKQQGSGLPKPAASFVDMAQPDRRSEPPPEPRPERGPEPITLDTLDPGHHPKVKAAIDAARAWAGRKRNGKMDASLVLVGPTGAGKTHIARAILWSMTQAAIDEDGQPIPGTARPMGRFYMADALIQSLDQSTYVSNLVGNAPLIVVDDVGSEQEIEYVAAGAQQREKQHRYFKLVNHCYDWQVSVIITSNLTLAELKDVLGARSWSRLAQMAPAGFMLDLSGVPDYRVQQSGRQP